MGIENSNKEKLLEEDCFIGVNSSNSENDSNEKDGIIKNNNDSNNSFDKRQSDDFIDKFRDMLVNADEHDEEYGINDSNKAMNLSFENQKDHSFNSSGVRSYSPIQSDIKYDKRDITDIFEKESDDIATVWDVVNLYKNVKLGFNQSNDNDNDNTSHSNLNYNTEAYENSIKNKLAIQRKRFEQQQQQQQRKKAKKINSKEKRNANLKKPKKQESNHNSNTKVLNDIRNVITSRENVYINDQSDTPSIIEGNSSSPDYKNDSHSNNQQPNPITVKIRHKRKKNLDGNPEIYDVIHTNSNKVSVDHGIDKIKENELKTLLNLKDDQIRSLKLRIQGQNRTISALDENVAELQREMQICQDAMEIALKRCGGTDDVIKDVQKHIESVVAKDSTRLSNACTHRCADFRRIEREMQYKIKELEKKGKEEKTKQTRVRVLSTTMKKRVDDTKQYSIQLETEIENLKKSNSDMKKNLSQEKKNLKNVKKEMETFRIEKQTIENDYKVINSAVDMLEKQMIEMTSTRKKENEELGRITEISKKNQSDLLQCRRENEILETKMKKYLELYHIEKKAHEDKINSMKSLQKDLKRRELIVSYQELEEHDKEQDIRIQQKKCHNKLKRNDNNGTKPRSRLRERIDILNEAEEKWSEGNILNSMSPIQPPMMKQEIITKIETEAKEIKPKLSIEDLHLNNAYDDKNNLDVTNDNDSNHNSILENYKNDNYDDNNEDQNQNNMNIKKNDSNILDSDTSSDTDNDDESFQEKSILSSLSSLDEDSATGISLLNSSTSIKGHRSIEVKPEKIYNKYEEKKRNIKDTSHNILGNTNRKDPSIILHTNISTNKSADVSYETKKKFHIERKINLGNKENSSTTVMNLDSSATTNSYYNNKNRCKMKHSSNIVNGVIDQCKTTHKKLGTNFDKIKDMYARVYGKEEEF